MADGLNLEADWQRFINHQMTPSEADAYRALLRDNPDFLDDATKDYLAHHPELMDPYIGDYLPGDPARVWHSSTQVPGDLTPVQPPPTTLPIAPAPPPAVRPMSAEGGPGLTAPEPAAEAAAAPAPAGQQPTPAPPLATPSLGPDESIFNVGPTLVGDDAGPEPETGPGDGVVQTVLEPGVSTEELPVEFTVPGATAPPQERIPPAALAIGVTPPAPPPPEAPPVDRGQDASAAPAEAPPAPDLTPPPIEPPALPPPVQGGVLVIVGRLLRSPAGIAAVIVIIVVIVFGARGLLSGGSPTSTAANGSGTSGHPAGSSQGTGGTQAGGGTLPGVTQPGVTQPNGAPPPPGVIIDTNEFSFDGLTCQTAKHIAITVKLSGIAEGTQVMLEFTGPDVPATLTFTANPDEPYTQEWPLDGKGGRWNDQVVSIGGRAPPSAGAHSGTIQQC